MMRPPPLLLGAALLFWGWRVDMLALGAIAGGLIEFSHGIKGRWDFSDKEFNRLWDICTVLFVAAAVYLRFSEEITSAAYKFFQWMPMIFFPMALGSAYATRDGVPFKAFSWFLRRKGATGGDRLVAFAWAYFAVCIITAGSTNIRDLWYFAGFAVLTGVALWSVRPRSVPGWAWLTLFAVMAGAAFYGQSRLPDAQAYFEMRVSELFAKFARREFDPNRNRTAMGRIGSLKQSGRIVLKIKPELGTFPERLRQGTYHTLDGVVWLAGSSQFDAVAVEPDLTTWSLDSNRVGTAAVRMIERVGRKEALLSLPMGTVQLRELAVGAVETNRFLVTKTRENPGLLNYTAHFGRASLDRPPPLRDNRDLAVPLEETNAIVQIAREMNIDELPPREKILRIVDYFQSNFRYTTYQQARELGLHAKTPLTEFLTKTRAGHCEYFATATVLLLRQFEIPARYAIGYSVQEKSKDDEYYVVRERHGHAWALAYIDGDWVEVDSTPAGWDEAEAEDFPFYQPLKDAWERFTFAFLEWRWLGEWGVIRIVAPWLAAPLIGFLAWRIFGRKMLRRNLRPREAQAWPGADSEFFELEKRLAKSGLARENNETTAQWRERVAANSPGLAEMLVMIVRLHYKYRFNPEGLEAAEREQLRQLVGYCLAKV